MYLFLPTPGDQNRLLGALAMGMMIPHWSFQPVVARKGDSRVDTSLKDGAESLNKDVVIWDDRLQR
jgi:hypothetical protein